MYGRKLKKGTKGFFSRLKSNIYILKKKICKFIYFLENEIGKFKIRKSL
jgi:hypothetical protein